MPVLSGSAYVTVEQVLSRIRMIIDDSEVAGGDVLTDTAPFTFDVINGAFERVQKELAIVGVETAAAESWLINLPAMPTSDPEGRLIVSDSGTQITYPSGIGNVSYVTPQLPTNLVCPLKLWERQTATSNFTGPPMRQCNDGLINMNQQQILGDWQWLSDGLYFRGALQNQDVKLRYEKNLPLLVTVNDPVPIRGVTNAAAYWGAKMFIESRGGMIAPMLKATADEEIMLLRFIHGRRRQRKQVRRAPYSGRSRGGQSPIA